MRITCPGCGQDVPGGFERPSELCWCSSKCAETHGAPDQILRRLRQLEAEAAAKPKT